MKAEKQFNTGELTLDYVEAGSGQPLVALHGLTSNRQAWYPLLPKFASRWHVYVPDLRGHGTSGRAPDHHYANADYASDIIAFLKHIGQPVVLMGHSLGAMVAIIVAAQYPEGVSALILLDPPLLTYTDNVQTSPEPAKWFNLVSTVMKGSPSRETIVARLREMMPGTPDEQLNGMVGWLAQIDPGTTDVALRDEMWQGVDLPQTLHQIKCPTLLVQADWDHGGAMRDIDIERFRQNMPSARVVKLDDSDHGLKMQEHPEIVLGYVDSFLQSVSPA